MYEIEFSKEAVKHVLVMRKSSPHLFKKLEKLLDELREHPYTGTGHPEQLKFLQGVWSRQLDKKNRIRSIFMRFTPYQRYLYFSSVSNIPKAASPTDCARWWLR